jgi:hypothetical protein
MFAALVCSGLVSLVFVTPYLLMPHLEAYGSFGTDMWGYVSTSEWVRHHSIHELPTPGSPMRYNWVWCVLSIQERPLTYTALACYGSAAGITPIQAYVAFPAALMASLSMSLCLTPCVFGLSRFVYAIPFALLVSVHPLVLVHWIFQFFSGAIVSGCVCLSFAALLSTQKGRARMEALSLCLLILVFCSALYSREFLLVALFSAGLPGVVDLYGIWRTSGLRLRGSTPISWLVWSAGAMAVLTAAGTLVFTQPTAYGGPSGHVAGQILTIFGGASPPWFGYGGITPSEYVPEFDLSGWLMAVLTLGFLGHLALIRWRQSRDISIPVALLTAAGCIYVVSNSLVSLSRVLPIFGPAMLFGLAVLSCEIRSRRAAFAVALLCSLPLLRSSSVVINFLHKPDQTLYGTDTNLTFATGR